MSEGAWYKTGQAGQEEAKKIQEETQKRMEAPQRVWLPANAGSQFIFLDSDGFYFYEHNFRKGATKRAWMNWETCIEGISRDVPCPMCAAGFTRSYVAVWSVIDVTGYKPARGEARRFLKRLLVAKSRSREKILRQRDRQGGNLTFCAFDAFRASRDECATGETYDFVKRYTEDDLRVFHRQAYFPPEKQLAFPEWLKPYDYISLFAPSSVADLQKIADTIRPVGSEDRKDTSPDYRAGDKTSEEDSGGDSMDLDDAL